MDKFDQGFVFGVVVVLIVFITIHLVFPSSEEEALDKCAKTHNVYQCEMVAVPKTGEVK